MRYNTAMTPPDGSSGMIPSSIQQWLQQGELLYSTAVKEYQAIEAQLDELERRLTAKRAEVNQIATIVGKPPVEGSRRLSAQLVTSYAMDDDRERDKPLPGTANIARALSSGKPRGIIPPPPVRANP